MLGLGPTGRLGIGRGDEKAPAAPMTGQPPQGRAVGGAIVVEPRGIGLEPEADVPIDVVFSSEAVGHLLHAVANGHDGDGHNRDSENGT